MKIYTFIKRMLPFILFMVIVTVSRVYGIGGGSAGEHETTFKDWIWPIINFLILVAVLYYFARKPVREYFKKRTELIDQSLREAREAREIAQKTLEEVRERLKNTDREIEQILESAKQSGEKEKKNLIAEGEKMKQKILEQARSNIEFELQKAREKIKSEAALMALELAEKQLKEKLTKKEQEELLEDYLKRLEAKN